MNAAALDPDPLAGCSKYRSLRLLGRGGMGEVVLAEHVALGSKVVVKLLHAELGTKAHLVDRLRLEAQALARLSHPNLVKVTDFDRTPAGRPFIVMEYLAGRSLRDELTARGGTLPVLDAIDLACQALAGLAVAHEAGLVHRDVKLDNLFAVAQVVEGASEAPAPLMVPTGTGIVVGTPRFLAPEQARAQPLDHRADIYALGLVLYTLLAGRGPFDDARDLAEIAKAHIIRQPEPPSRFAAQPIPPALDAAVLRSLEKSPDARFQSAAEMAAELRRIAASCAQVAPAPAGWIATVPLGAAEPAGVHAAPAPGTTVPLRPASPVAAAAPRADPPPAPGRFPPWAALAILAAAAVAGVGVGMLLLRLL
ncbi:MAG: serine/threonine protein kinase [Deltaproteobacteria bacterium]|nr:serine/threonine protein kinase [Deltaproteobacteria bacterium]